MYHIQKQRKNKLKKKEEEETMRSTPKTYINKVIKAPGDISFLLKELSQTLIRIFIKNYQQVSCRVRHAIYQPH